MSKELESREKLDKLFKTRVEDAPITRLEVIDEQGRAYANYNISSIEFSLQDGSRTLKIFINNGYD